MTVTETAFPLSLFSCVKVQACQDPVWSRLTQRLGGEEVREELCQKVLGSFGDNVGELVEGAEAKECTSKAQELLR